MTTYLLDWAVAERVKHVLGTGRCCDVTLHLFGQTHGRIQTASSRLRDRLTLQHKALVHRSVGIWGVGAHLRSRSRSHGIAVVLP